MKGTTLVILLLGLICTVKADKWYEGFPGKRLNNVIKNVTSSTRTHCVLMCSQKDGCLAVNFIGCHDACEMTSGLSDVTEMSDDVTSELLILKVERCPDPNYCLNGGTCVVPWSYPRCLCTSRYQGDMCQACALRFTGNNCDTCSARFEGPNCENCVAQRNGSECQDCISGYYGHRCDVYYDVTSDHKCTYRELLSNLLTNDPASIINLCKRWCAFDDRCLGVELRSNGCFSFSVCTGTTPESGTTLYTKVV